MKKLISVFLALILLFLCASCSKEDEEETTSAVSGAQGIALGSDTLKLAYLKSDSLNPFEATSTVNIKLTALLYDGLFTVNSAYEAVPCIAESFAVSKTALNITIAPCAFSDGSPVAVSDVVYSFNLAKKSPAYSASLSNFTTASASTSNMLVIGIASPDPYAAACLNFPIIKSGSVGDFPTGSGRYSAQVTQDAIYLVANVKHGGGFNPIIKTIKLVGLKEESALSGSLEIGNTCFYYDELADGEFSRINAKTVESGMNNLVYLGFNSASPVFADASLRRAANLALNRKEIAETAFQGHARIAYTPFNPDWYLLQKKDLVVAQNLPEAQKLVSAAASSAPLKEVTLLVNADNPFKVEAAQLISKQLSAVGFTVAIKALKLEGYTSAVNSLGYDIYIGEMRLNKNMDLSPLLLGGAVSFGINPAAASCARYSSLLEGGCEIMDFINTFNDDLAFLPLCYRNAAASYTNSLAGNYACCDGDVFCDIDTWYFKATGE